MRHTLFRDRSFPAPNAALRHAHDASAAIPVRQARSRIGPGTRVQRPRLSVVVPCRNEARNLPELLPLLIRELKALVDQWEIVLVDDGSTDDTASLLRAWCALPGVTSVRLSRNFGKEAALTAGLRHAQGDVVVSMDADLQHPPRLIGPMLERWHGGADMVYAARMHRDDEPRIKRWGARVFYRVLNAFERFQVPRNGGDFRLMDRAAVDALLALPERNRFMKGLYAWVGFEAVSLPYLPDERRHGRSHFRLGQLVRLSLDGLTAFTTWPLRLATAFGLAVALAALGYGALLTVKYLLWGNEVSGWTTIVVGGALLIGMQMILLGIMGEYVGRIFEEVKGRPLYVVRELLGDGLADQVP